MTKNNFKDQEYKILLDGMKDGDYLFIGLGHNDEKLEQERYTNPKRTYLDQGSFANSLYENYIKKAEEVLENEVDDKTSLFPLPSTGDKNTSVYYLIGTILVVFVVGVIFYKKKTKRA